MDQKEILRLLLNLSPICLAVAAAFVIVFSLFVKRSAEGALRLKGYKVLPLVLGMVGALGCLHYAVLYYEIAAEATSTSWLEALGSCLVKTGDAFGIDENLDEFLESFRQMLLFTGITEDKRLLAWGCYAGALFVIAPVLGGIGLLEILAGFFPRVQLFFAGLAWFKDKYYFSQLNDGSLELARSICRVDMRGFKSFKRPVLIFANVDPGNDEEGNARRVSEAKALGAICLRSDLKSIPKGCWGKKKYLLIEEDETQVLQHLAELGTGGNYRKLKNAEVFFFVTSDAYEPIDKWIRKELDHAFVDKKLEDYRKKQAKKNQGLTKKEIEEEENRLKAKWRESQPCLFPVRTHFNLIMNLLTEIPLFEPLIGKKENPDGSRDLVVSILGAGGLGMEMFLNTYWMGQMLDCNLIINVYSQEEKADFEARLDHINPEILRTTKPEDDLLRIDRHGKRSAKPYCTLNYVQCKLGEGDLKTVANGIEASDYCLVALGSDMENIDMAGHVCRCVGEHHITHQDAKTVIAYVVYDPKVAEVLNREQWHAHLSADKPDVFMQAVGTLREVYSVHNVFMPECDGEVQEVHNAYQAIQNPEKRKKANWERARKTEYDYWANIARVKHNPYKLYSTGKITISIFSRDGQKDLSRERKEEETYALQLLKLEAKKNLPPAEEYRKLLNRISWLEHRRWNAFTRIMGFRSTKLHLTYAAFTNNHKHMPLRLHPCLVECDEMGIRSGLGADLLPIAAELSYLEEKDRDMLDELTYELYKTRGKTDDFKFYDYFRYQ